MTETQERLKNAQKNYRNEIKQIALDEFNRLVIPFCEKNHMTFTNGMGDWWFRFTEKTPESIVEKYKDRYSANFNMWFTDSDKLPKEIRDTLNLDTLFNGCLGEFMPEYK